MRQAEPDRVIARIAELKSILALARSHDVRETIRMAIADCEARLADLDAEPAEYENLRYDVALLSRLRADAQPDKIAVQACDEVMRTRYARLEELVRTAE